MKEWYTYKNTKYLSEIKRILEKAAPQGWRVPTSEELAEALRSGAAESADYVSWYWSADLVAESPLEHVRRHAERDPEMRIVVKWHGKESDTAILAQYGTILVRDLP